MLRKIIIGYPLIYGKKNKGHIRDKMKVIPLIKKQKIQFPGGYMNIIIHK